MNNKAKYKQSLWLAFLGPDGSGKSSVIEGVKERLNPETFTAVEVIHLRPHIGLNNMQKKNFSVVADNPHGEKCRSQFSSIIKIMYFFFDYTLGYFIKIKPLLKNNTLVIFDRYYYDLLVDPKRYRYGGLMWFARLIGRFIPRPNLVILLNASAKTIQSRKQEVSAEETARQTGAYINLANNMKNAIIIDAEQPIEKVVDDVNNAISNYMICRMERRLGK